MSHSRAFLLCLFLLAAAFPARSEEPPLEPISGFDLQRYLGLWHEIASIPSWFQDHCASDTTARYGLAETEGMVTVLNACRDAEGVLDSADGFARFTGPADRGGLEVTFLSVFGEPLWLISGDYVVIALGEDYSWSAVAHPSRDYAWILAREPDLPSETIREITQVFAEAGYDTCAILTTPRIDEEARRPLCEL